MSYQQTRSTQDPPFYPKNISNVLSLTSGGAAPAVSSEIALIDPANPAVALADIRTYSALATPGVPLVIAITPTSPNQRILLETRATAMSTASTAVVGAQYVCWPIVVAGGITQIGGPTAGVDTGVLQSGFTLWQMTVTSGGGAYLINLLLTGGPAAPVKVTMHVGITCAAI